MTAWLFSRFAPALEQVWILTTKPTHSRVLWLTLALLLVMAALLGPSSNPPVASASPPRGFNRNHHADLVIGVPHENVNAVVDAGTVQVLYGQGSAGLSATGNQWWSQGQNTVPDSAESNDEFGSSLAIGDFNGDGYYDLAIGVPYEDVGAIVDAGAVHVLYGSSSGLSGAGNQIWTQNTFLVEDASEASDMFGRALAAGDFNGDGRDDLAIGVPLEDAGATNDGAVNILYGSSTGLTANLDQFWYQGFNGLVGTAENGDEFGYSLAVGDFNHDGKDDLAVGLPYEDGPGGVDSGFAIVIYGGSSGLTSTGAKMFSQVTAGVGGTQEAVDLFAFALATGDFDGDGYADLAVGVPNEDTGSTTNNGAVNILYGSATGLSGTGSQFLYQGSSGVAGTAENGDLFGYSLAAGDFNGDGRSDLAVGTPFEDNGAVDNGVVVLIYGSSTGLTGAGSIYLRQGLNGLQGTPANSELFSRALAAGDFDGDQYDDLAIGVPFEAVSGQANAGAVNVVYGSNFGITTTGNQFWNQNSPGMGYTTAEADDNFGFVLAAAPARAAPLYLPLVTR